MCKSLNLIGYHGNQKVQFAKNIKARIGVLYNTAPNHILLTVKNQLSLLKWLHIWQKQKIAKDNNLLNQSDFWTRLQVDRFPYTCSIQSWLVCYQLGTL